MMQFHSLKMLTKFYSFVFLITFLETDLIFSLTNEINSEIDRMRAKDRSNDVKIAPVLPWPMLTLWHQKYTERKKRQVTPQCQDDDGFPFELHIPGYRFCGPGTKYLKKMEDRDAPKNSLDAACMTHDTSYTYNCKDSHELFNADKRLLRASSGRIIAADASLGERISAVLVTTFISVRITYQTISSLF